MNHLQIFLPCAAGTEAFLAAEAARITGQPLDAVHTRRGGVQLHGHWRDALALNLHSLLAQRVLVHLSTTPYRQEQDLYDAAYAIAWEAWFTPRHSFRIDTTAQHSPLKSLNFATLKVKDAVADRFRDKTGSRPDVQTQWPDVRLHIHLTAEAFSVYIDTSGEALFKRGWRTDKGDAPLKETLAAAMLIACEWDGQSPLYDPCCGSGTIPIEAAQMARRIAPGQQRRFGFEKLLPYQSHVWHAMKDEAKNLELTGAPPIFGSDVSHRMVDFAQRNAERAGVADSIQLRGGDALQRMPPTAEPGTLLLNPPYGERIAAGGVAGAPGAGRSAGYATPMRGERGGRENAVVDGLGMAAPTADDNDDFFRRLSQHWKANYSGWQAWLLTPDLKLPGRMRLRESRRVPLWNGPIECRLFRFDLTPPPPRASRVPREADAGHPPPRAA